MKFRNISICVLISLFLCSCSFAADVKPYSITGKMVIDKTGYEENSYFSFSFINHKEKEVKSFVLSFYLFDEDGNPASDVSPKIKIKIDKVVGAGENLESYFSLDQFVHSIPEEPFNVEFIYISKIIYQDGSEWNDPFGLSAF